MEQLDDVRVVEASLDFDFALQVADRRVLDHVALVDLRRRGLIKMSRVPLFYIGNNF